MQLPKTKILTLVFSIILLSCSEDKISSNFIVDSNHGLDLKNIEVGNKSTYVMYSSECGSNFQFTGDTLLVEITENIEGIFMTETFTDGSILEGSRSHKIEPHNDYLLVPNRGNSNLLFFYGNDTIFLEREPSVALHQEDCQLFTSSSQFVGDEIGQVERFTVGPIIIEDRKSISCVPMVFDLDAYIFYDDRLSAIHTIQRIDSSFVGDGFPTVGFVAID